MQLKGTFVWDVRRYKSHIYVVLIVSFSVTIVKRVEDCLINIAYFV